MPAETNFERVLSFAAARQCVEEHTRGIAPPQVETLPLGAVANRLLAEDLVADRDFPPFHRSARDGFALRAADIATCPARLKVVAHIKAGDAWPASRAPLAAGECAEIMTGAPAPPGADAVVMVEDTAPIGNDDVEVRRSISFGANIVPQGSEAKAGDVVLHRGTRITSAHIAVAASVGMPELNVYRRPRVAILSTGDEVVDIRATPGPAQIRNSNAWSLAAQINVAGGEAVMLPIAPDEPARLRELIVEGLAADLLLLSGGVSMGKHDLVEPVLRELGAEFFFTGALIQPGKPVVFGRAVPDGDKSHVGPAKYFFGLPGNPVSTMVTFDLFAHPMLDVLCGARPTPLRFAQAVLKKEVKTRTGLHRFLPARLSGTLEKPEVELVPWQGSGDLFASSLADCYLVVPPDKEVFSEGATVSVLLR